MIKKRKLGDEEETKNGELMEDENKQYMDLSSFPPILRSKLSSILDPESFMNLQITNKKMSELFRDKNCWKANYVGNYNLSSLPSNSDKIDWEDLSKKRAYFEKQSKKKKKYIKKKKKNLSKKKKFFQKKTFCKK